MCVGHALLPPHRPISQVGHPALHASLLAAGDDDAGAGVVDEEGRVRAVDGVVVHRHVGVRATDAT